MMERKLDMTNDKRSIVVAGVVTIRLINGNVMAREDKGDNKSSTSAQARGNEREERWPFFVVVRGFTREKNGKPMTK